MFVAVEHEQQNRSNKHVVVAGEIIDESIAKNPSLEFLTVDDHVQYSGVSGESEVGVLALRFIFYDPFINVQQIIIQLVAAEN